MLLFCAAIGEKSRFLGNNASTRKNFEREQYFQAKIWKEVVNGRVRQYG